MIKTFDDFVNEGKSVKAKVQGSIGGFKFFEDPRLGTVIILIVTNGVDQYEHQVQVNPSKDTPETLAKRFYVGKMITIKK